MLQSARIVFHNPGRIVFRRGDRVADCAALEMLCTRKGTEGSNPSFSARVSQLDTVICKM